MKKLLFLFLFIGLQNCFFSDNRYDHSLVFHSPRPNYQSKLPYQFQKIVDTPMSLPFYIDHSVFLSELIDSHHLSMDDYYNVYTEQLINSFAYNFSPPIDNEPLYVYSEAARSPWHENTYLAFFSIRANPYFAQEGKQASVNRQNIVFTIDISGSNQKYIPRIKYALKRLAGLFSEQDSITIILFNNRTEILFDSNRGNANLSLPGLVETVRASGGTDSWPAIQFSYRQAVKKSCNDSGCKIFFFTDGDFGGTNLGQLKELLRNPEMKDISFIALDSGNSPESVRKIFLQNTKNQWLQLTSRQQTLLEIVRQTKMPLNEYARDLTTTLTWNHKEVKNFRFIGFKRFNYTKKKKKQEPNFVFTGYQNTFLIEYRLSSAIKTEEPMAIIQLKYKNQQNQPIQKDFLIGHSNAPIWQASANMRFATGVAAFMANKKNSHSYRYLDHDMAIHLLRNSLDYDPGGYRKKFFRFALSNP